MPPQHQSTTFKGDVLRLITGTALAQIITVLASPIVTRLYTPEVFGVAALFASLTGILSVLACMRYELSIVLSDSDREAANLLGVSLCFSVFIALLTVLVIVLAGPQVLRWIRMPELGPYLWLAPIVVLIQGAFIALNYWNTRTKHFTRLSIARVTSAILTTTATLGAGFAGHATSGAKILATVGGQAVATAVLGGQIWRDNGRFIQASITWLDMWAGVKRHRNFPIYNSWSILINSASWQFPAILFGVFFSPAVVGFYSLGFGILHMPLSMIVGAIGQVFLQRASAERKTGKLTLLVENICQRQLMLLSVPILILAIVGEDIFSLFFGMRWAEAGVYTQILAPWVLVWFIASPLSMIYIALEQQKKEPIAQGLIFSTRLLSIIIGGYFDNPRLAMILFSASGVFSYGYIIKVIFNLCHISTYGFIKKNMKIIFIAICYIIPLLLAKLTGLNQIVLLLVSLVTGIVYVSFNRKVFLSIFVQRFN